MRSCPCGCASGDVFEKLGKRHMRCADCRSIVLLDGIDTSIYLRDYHDRHQRRIGHVPYRLRFDQDYALAHKRLDAIEKRRAWKTARSNLRLLDIGCSNGAFVVAACDRGFKAIGFEVNADIAEHAQARGARVLVQPSGVSAAIHAGHYDVVTAHDVLEHFALPAEELAAWRRLVAPGCLLVVDTPDADCLLAHHRGVDYHHIRPDEHFHLFSEALLRRLLTGAGFRVIDVDRPIEGKLVAYAEAV